jgi:glutathione S-transferase
MFMAEKSIELPKQTIDLRGGENRQPPYLTRNPYGQMPALELDDGFFLSEVTVICDYLEELQPTPAMIGSTPQERAECRMWTRRIDLGIVEPMAYGYRYSEGLKFFESRLPCFPESAPGLKSLAAQNLKKLNDLMAGKTYVCGDRFTLADMWLFCWVEFGATVKQPLAAENTNIAAWRERIAERPSTKA